MTSEAPPVLPYLTWVPHRTPRNKAHEDLGQAKKAILFRLQDGELVTDCKVYKWANNQWELLWDIKQGTRRWDMPWHQ